MEATPTKCFVCGTTRPCLIHKFVVLNRWFKEPICKPCWEEPTDEPQTNVVWEEEERM